MLVGIASIIMSIGTSITLFIQTLSLSRCKNIECCSVSCTQDDMQFGKQKKKEHEEQEQDTHSNNNMHVARRYTGEGDTLFVD